MILEYEEGLKRGPNSEQSQHSLVLQVREQRIAKERVEVELPGQDLSLDLNPRVQEDEERQDSLLTSLTGADIARKGGAQQPPSLNVTNSPDAKKARNHDFAKGLITPQRRPEARGVWEASDI